ncbi:MAG: OmpA family protein [Balneolaceae bacterium]
MKRKIQLLVLALFFAGGTIIQYGCGSSGQMTEPEVLTMEYLESLSDEELRERDSDEDGVSDYDEMREHGTDPLNPDTDDDGLSDGEEINEYNTDPLNADTDGDDLSDGDEVNSYNTDPLNTDTDDDGLNDGEEVNEHRTDPNLADSDDDGISDYDEVMTHETDPNNADTDGDGFADGQELEMGTDPLDAEDPLYLDEDTFGTINFDFDRSNIRDDAAQILAENVEILKEAEAFRVRVDAYTDHIGGDQYNLRLSLRRANAVVDFYTQNGISEDRIEARGLGKAPVECMDETEERGCERNRRAESHPISTLQYSPNRNN